MYAGCAGVNVKIILRRYEGIMKKEAEDFNKIFAKAQQDVILGEKRYKFFERLVNPESPSCGEIVKSYHLAGYVESGTSKYNAYKVYRSPKFQKVLTEYRRIRLEMKENRSFTMLERTSEDLAYVIEMAKDKNDLSTMRQAVMDRAKLHGLLVERHQVIDPATEAEIDKTKQIEARILAEQRLLGEAVEVPDNIVETTFIDQTEPDCQVEVSNDMIETAILEQ